MFHAMWSTQTRNRIPAGATHEITRGHAWKNEVVNELYRKSTRGQYNAIMNTIIFTQHNINKSTIQYHNEYNSIHTTQHQQEYNTIPQSIKYRMAQKLYGS